MIQLCTSFLGWLGYLNGCFGHTRCLLVDCGVPVHPNDEVGNSQQCVITSLILRSRSSWCADTHCFGNHILLYCLPQQNWYGVGHHCIHLPCGIWFCFRHVPEWIFLWTFSHGSILSASNISFSGFWDIFRYPLKMISQGPQLGSCATVSMIPLLTLWQGNSD